MKRILLAEMILAFLIAVGFRYGLQRQTLPRAIDRAQIYQNRLINSCSPDWSVINVDSLAETIIPLPGWGNFRWNIAAKNDSARFYFNQGINMYYAFHIIESMASFKKAATFDATNPMILWAQALAYGPNINDFEYAPSADALRMATKAKEYAAFATVPEQALISAMLVRYSADTSISRKQLNAAYANQMKVAYAKFTDDANIAALYADALMLQHPWEYWKHDGTAHAWTPEILNVLEKGLAAAPLHPGLNHYYIHTTEAGPNPIRAIESADRLGNLMPGVSHMIHMPSHIYIRTGSYSKGITVNQQSVSGYKNYLGLFPEVEKNVGLYLIHNLHMQAACAMFQLQYDLSMNSAVEARNSFDTSYLSLPQPMGNYMQYVYMTPAFVNVRYGKWDELIYEKEVPSNYSYAYVLSLWSKGMAHAVKGNSNKANEYLRRMQSAMKHPDLQVVLFPFNAAISSAKIAEKLLEGVILEKTGRLQSAIDNFKLAVKLEDSLIYTEPRDWLLPSRHYLANALKEKGNNHAAEKILEEDLLQNPDNFYSMNALAIVFKKQGKMNESRVLRDRLVKLYPTDKYLLPPLSY